ncbi:MAG: hypothetical protein B6244_10630 [Candidatus Cloacimonetes bacterium 4572_55]|nr:MAG: hypothetical protein B6244_10630 [Candidatus Cloacimonetes bacterium 4572_55]
MLKKNAPVLEVFIFFIDDYLFGVDIAMIDGIQDPEEFEVCYQDEAGNKTTMLLDSDQILGIPHQRNHQRNSGISKILLLENEGLLYGFKVYNPQGIISLKIDDLYEIPQVIKYLRVSTFWAATIVKGEIVLLVDLSTLAPFDHPSISNRLD